MRNTWIHYPSFKETKSPIRRVRINFWRDEFFTCSTPFTRNRSNSVADCGAVCRSKTCTDPRVPCRVPSRIYHLGEKSWVAEGDKPPRGVRPPSPPDKIWCILRHNFEKCYSVCTNLVASWWFFRYSYLYTVMITIFFWGKLGILGGGGEASTPQIP